LAAPAQREGVGASGHVPEPDERLDVADVLPGAGLARPSEQEQVLQCVPLSRMPLNVKVDHACPFLAFRARRCLDSRSKGRTHRGHADQGASSASAHIVPEPRLVAGRRRCSPPASGGRNGGRTRRRPCRRPCRSSVGVADTTFVVTDRSVPRGAGADTTLVLTFRHERLDLPA